MRYNYHNKIHIKLGECEWKQRHSDGGKLWMIMMLFIKRELQLGAGSERFNTCKSDSLTPDCCIVFGCLRPFFMTLQSIER